jgi:hypothetical protein
VLSARPAPKDGDEGGVKRLLNKKDCSFPKVYFSEFYCHCRAYANVPHTSRIHISTLTDEIQLALEFSLSALELYAFA